MEKIIEMLEENLLLRYIVTGIALVATSCFAFGAIGGIVFVCMGHVVGGLICTIVCGLLAGAAGGVTCYLVEE